MLRIAQFFEQQGLSHSEGRVLGLLMVSEERQLDFSTMLLRLQLIKSTVSTALTNLIHRHMVNQTQPYGSRKRYFSLHPPFTFDEVLHNIGQMKSFAEEILHLHQMQRSTSDKVLLLQHTIQAYSIVEHHMLALKADFESMPCHSQKNNTHHNETQTLNTMHLAATGRSEPTGATR